MVEATLGTDQDSKRTTRQTAERRDGIGGFRALVAEDQSPSVRPCSQQLVQYYGFGDLRQRIREVKQGPDGLIYFITDTAAGAMLKVEPVAPPAAPPAE